MREQLITDLAANLYMNNVQWSRDGVKFTPTKEDVRQVVDELYTLVYADTDGSTTALKGGIMVTRDGEHIDVYLYMGEL